MQVALNNYLQARYCHSGGVAGPNEAELELLSSVTATILANSRHFGAQVVQARRCFVCFCCKMKCTSSAGTRHPT
jgi:hypothetical protein